MATADTQEVFAAVGTLRNTILLVILAVVVAVFGLALAVMYRRSRFGLATRAGATCSGGRSGSGKYR